MRNEVIYDKTKQLAPLPVFARRVALHIGIAAVLLGCALSIGIAGYHWIAGLAWVDALLDASMILAGMGPVATLTTDDAKIFASCYALFSGLMFIFTMGIVLAPLAHRFLHKWHLDDKDK